MAVKLKDIAHRVGVKESTVSVVLNKKTTRIKVSDETTNRIFKVAQELGYHPNASARALVTKRTGYIGFILPDNVAGGWRNDYYAAHLAGVERACRQNGYGLTISQYNLSNISSFVFPSRVGQRSIDGVVLIGYIQQEVASEFKKFGLPCVCIGDDLEIANMMPTVSTQVVEGRLLAIKHLARLGHRHIGYPCQQTPRAKQVYSRLCQKIKEDYLTQDCLLEIIMPPAPYLDFEDATPIFEQWINTSVNSRPTAIISTDPVLILIEQELAKHHLSCPGDLSLMSVAETQLSQSGIPAISGVHFDYELVGETAANILIGHLTNESSLSSKYFEYFPAELKIRESCGRPSMT